LLILGHETDKISTINPINFGRFWEMPQSKYLLKKVLTKDGKGVVLNSTTYTYTFDSEQRVKTLSLTTGNLTSVVEYTYTR
jgi:hypothetical protein